MNLSVLLMRRRLMLEDSIINFELKMNEDNSFYNLIKSYDGKDAIATLNKLFQLSKWDFICLPFYVNPSLLTSLSMRDSIYEFRYANNELTPYFSLAITIKAGKCYIINANDKLSEKTQFIFPNVTVDTSADSGSSLSSASDYDLLDGYKSSGDVELVGTLRTGHLTGSSNYTYYTLQNNKLFELDLTKDNFIPAYYGVFRKLKTTE